ncbi:MAG: glycosyltransferase family 9 protein [Bdellovibrionales bacterium]|nr:glycosyltransferase family 9 protein [Bdellovibrionales bacterium]
MKVLVVSMLRLGDLIMTLPVARGLKAQFPGAEVHYLVHDDLQSLGDILADVDRLHFFPRKELQGLIRDCSQPAFAPWQSLEAFFRRLNRENFDRVINLTHTRLSQHVVSQIEAEDVQGAHTDESGVAAFGSSWFRLLDQWSVDNLETEFHYSDVFWHGSGLGHFSRQPVLRETEAGRAEVQELLQDEQGPVMCIQALTSDAKKNWGIQKYGETVKQLSEVLPNYRYFFLCAPNERAQIEPEVQKLREQSINAKLACVSLAGLISVLKRSRLLITGDTGVKHLASAVECQVLELSLGSSSLTRTGVVLEGSLIVQTKEGCAPCRHSVACHRESHVCSEGMTPRDISQLAFWTLAGARSEIQKLAHEQRHRFAAYEVVRTFDGDWMPRFLGKDFLYDSMAYQLHQASWKIFSAPSEATRPKGLSRFVYDLRKEMDLSVQSIGKRSSQEILQKLSRDLQRVSTKMKALRTRVFWAIRHGEPLETTLHHVASQCPPLQWYSRRFEEWKSTMQMGEFLKMRRLIDLCEEVLTRTDIEIKILEMAMETSSTQFVERNQPQKEVQL